MHMYLHDTVAIETYVYVCVYIYMIYNIYIWATVNIWYITPSHEFWRVYYRFRIFVYKQMLSFFEECIIVFQAPAQFPKNKDVSNTTLH